ncbi:MAG: glycerol kinase GlpK [Clostridiales bacterium]
MNKYIIALDQGTTNSKCIVFNKDTSVVGSGQKEFEQIFPRTGWVEHDPLEILDSQLKAIKKAMSNANISEQNIEAIGITNQRETTILWDKNTGKPVYNAIVWQCRRTSNICDELKKNGMEKEIKEKTGLVIDAYFSATKIKWILDNVEGVREEAEKGNILFGTVDSWLIWNLTKGKVHITDYSNASRTMLYNIYELKWDNEILRELNIPKQILPEVKPTSHIYCHTDVSIFGRAIPIASAVGDQQASLFGQNCYQIGEGKNTYGTGGFMLMNTGQKSIVSKNGLVTSIAWGIDNKIEYALEGSIFVAGAAIQWLRDDLKILDNAYLSEFYALSVPDTKGVYVVPAFVGLGAPYWDQYARGAIFGISRGAKKEHIIRATLESLAYQTYDVMKAMEKDSNTKMKFLKVDGGACENKFLMQFQADILNIPIERPKNYELTALGACCLAGLAVGYWQSKDEIRNCCSISETFLPNMSNENRNELLKGWHKAIKRSMNWID